MIGWRSLEVRLTAWYSLLLLAGYAIFVLSLWLTVRHALSRAVDELLSQRVERLVERVSSEAEHPEEIEEELIESLLAVPESHLARIRSGDNRAVFPLGAASSRALPWPEAQPDNSFRTVQWEGASYRVLQQDVSLMDRPYRVLLASSLENLMVIRDRLTTSLLIATPLALLLCSGGGLYIARRALIPLQQIAEAASDITVSSLSRRMEVPDTGDALEELARTFNRMLERLETSVARLEQFSADASHELRTPLSVIRTTAELALRHGRTEDAYRDDLSNILTEARRLSDLVEVLLNLSRQESEQASVPMDALDLVALATDVCRQFRAEAEARELKLELLAPERPLILMGNDPALRRMIASLLENALARTRQGAITVTLGAADGELRLSVKDTGEGIPEAALGKVFDRFFRVDPSRGRSSGGLGLGLSIAQRIAELHRGTLAVTSRVGEGSEFTARFAAAS